MPLSSVTLPIKRVLLNTPANDAGLIAQTLEAAGFEVVGARDLDQDTMHHSFRDFLDKAEEPQGRTPLHSCI